MQQYEKSSLTKKISIATVHSLYLSSKTKLTDWSLSEKWSL